MNSEEIMQKIQEVESGVVTKVEKNNIKQFFIDGKMNITLKEQTNVVLIFIEFAFITLAVVHTVMVQLIISNDQNYPLQQTLENFYSEGIFYRIIYAFMIILKVFLVLSVYLEVIEKRSIVGLSWINQQIFKSYTIFKEFDLALTSFLSLINWQENLLFFIASAVIYIIYAVYLQNYVIRKQLTYATSSSDYLMFRSLILLNYSLNIILLNLQNQTIFNAVYTCLGVVVFIWYLKYGHKIYHHSFLRKLYLILIAIFLTFYFKYFQNLLLSTTSISVTQISKIILIFISISIIFSLFLSKFQYFSQNSTYSIKEIDLSLSKLLELSYSNADYDDQLIGLLSLSQIALHSDDEERQNFYDPYLKCEIKSKDIYIQKQSKVRRYIKHLYQRTLENKSNDDNWNKYIDYCEFLCNYDHNYYEVQKLLQMVKDKPLHILQKIKMERIQSLLKESSSKLNHQLYDGALQIEHIIDSQKCFADIERHINRYIMNSISIWNILKLQQISLLQFRFLLKSSFKYVDLINQGWKNISSYFQINKKWSFVYIHYQYFIKNQKIKQKETDMFRTMKIDNQNIFEPQPIYFLPNNQECDLYNPLLLYNEETFCLRVGYESGDLLIRGTNKRFQSIVGYTQDQIFGSSIRILMDDDLRSIHHYKFHQWVEKGYISNENSYKIKNTEIITKQKDALPAFKYFKSFYDVEEGLQFFCMIKINVKPLRKCLQSSEIVSSKMLSKTSLKSSPNLEVNQQKVKSQFQPTGFDDRLEKNIFIKEQMLQPKQSYREIQYFKAISRLFLVVIISSILILLLITKSNSTNLTSYSNQFINYMSMYRFPVVLATNYMKNFLNVGNQTKIVAQIQTATTSFLTSAQTDLTKITIFDKSLNPSSTYYPYYNYSFLANQSQSQIDLFYLMASTISSLKNKLPVNRTSQQFQRFNSYLKPSYDNMMNITKFKLHESFATIFTQCIDNQMTFIFIQVAIFAIFVGILFTCIHNFIRKMKNILFILLDLNSVQIHNICTYWKYVKQHFDTIFLQFHSESSSLRQITSQNLIQKFNNLRKGEQKISMNKRSKQIKEDRERKWFEIKLRVLIIFIMVLVLTISISIEANMIIKLQALIVFQEAGFFFLKFFPTGPLVTMGCTEKYYADMFPSELNFRPQKYDDVLMSMYIFGNENNYIGEIVDQTSIYFTKQKNYFFGNPCTYNPAILTSAGINISKCESMSNGTFKSGLSSFLRYGQRQGLNCIRNNVNLTAAQLDEFTLGGTILSAYVLDAITTWVTEFATKIVALQQSNQIQCLIIIITIILIHFSINEMKILRIINEEYDFIKKVYLNLVPESLLISEKVIKQKFIIEGIVHS